jgi:hypothetical protein
MVLSSFAGQLALFPRAESGWSSPGIGPEMQRVSCELADQISLLCRKRENIDDFIAPITDESMKKFGGLGSAQATSGLFRPPVAGYQRVPAMRI